VIQFKSLFEKSLLLVLLVLLLAVLKILCRIAPLAALKIEAGLGNCDGYSFENVQCGLNGLVNFRNIDGQEM
jgi:hypothetical protein